MDLNRVLHDAGLALDNVDALDELLKQADDEVEEVRRQLDSEDPLQLQSQINELLSSADLPDMTHLESEVRELHQETKQHYAQAKFMHQHVAQLQLNAVSVHAVDAYITLANQVVSLSDKAREAVLSESNDAVGAFIAFVELHSKVRHLSAIRESTQPAFNLETSFCTRAQSLFVRIREHAVAHFRQQLVALGWPKPVKSTQQISDSDAWQTSVQLLRLQACVDSSILDSTTATIPEFEDSSDSDSDAGEPVSSRDPAYLGSIFNSLLSFKSLPPSTPPLNDSSDESSDGDSDQPPVIASATQLKSAPQTPHVTLFVDKSPLASLSLSHCPRSWIIQMLIEPFFQRFTYHFCGSNLSRPTNRLEKPEWWLTFVLDAIQQHAPFVLQHVQRQSLDALGSQIDSTCEFVWAIVGFVDYKLRTDWSQLRKMSDPLFRHLIDQLLEFGVELVHIVRDLSSLVQLPVSPTSFAAIPFAKNAEFLHCWLQADCSFAKERFHAVLDSQHPWRRVMAHHQQEQPKQRPSSFVDNDNEERDHGVVAVVLPEPTSWYCSAASDSVLTLVDSLSQRWRRAVCVGHFVRCARALQLPMLATFYYRCDAAFRECFARMQQNKWSAVKEQTAINTKADSIDELDESVDTSSGSWTEFASVLNSAHHIAHSMHEWSKDMLFIKLQFALHKQLPDDYLLTSISSHPEFEAFVASPLSDQWFVEADNDDEFSISQDSFPRIDQSQFLSGDAVGFWAAPVAAFAHLVEDHISALIGHIFNVFETGIDAFVAEGHMWLDSVSCDADTMDDEQGSLFTTSDHQFQLSRWLAQQSAGGLTPSVTLNDALLILRAQLGALSKSIHPFLFAELVRRLASKTDDLLFRCCIAGKHFSRAGARRFVQDVAALFVTFHAHSSSLNTLFPLLCDTVCLLSWPESDWQQYRQPSNMLSDVERHALFAAQGIRTLSVAQVLSIMRNLVLVAADLTGPSPVEEDRAEQSESDASEHESESQHSQDDEIVFDDEWRVEEDPEEADSDLR